MRAVVVVEAGGAVNRLVRRRVAVVWAELLAWAAVMGWPTREAEVGVVAKWVRTPSPPVAEVAAES